MKRLNHISPLKWLLTTSCIILIGGCEPQSEPVNIYKAKPQKVNDNKPFRKEKIETHPDSLDKNAEPMIVPINTDSSTTKDTTETFQQLEKKNETKKYRKIYLYNIHKRPPVS